MFYLPKPVLRTLARSGWPRRAFRWLRRPLVAVPVYAFFLYGWHFSFAFEAAVRNPLVHALQHMSFVGIGVIVWWSALEPKRRRMPGELWKIPYLLGARMIGMMLGMSFVLIRVPIYTLFLYGWHFSVFFEAAVRNPLVHALQHMSFVGIGILVWWSALNPKRRRVHGDLWKIPYLLGARMIGMMLGMSFVLIRVPIYTGVYGSGERKFGLTPIQDQQIAGALMVTVDLCIMVFALCYFFYKASQEADRDEAREREALLTSP